MTLTEILKKQEEIQERMVPKYLKKHIELANNLNLYSKALRPNNYFTGVSVSKLNPYIGAFGQIDNYDSIFNKSVFQTQNLTERYAFLDFDFNEFESQEIEGNEVITENSGGIILNEAFKMKQIITDIYRDNSILLKIQSREFEELIAELLRFQGFEVELTKQTRDNGYDILAIKKLFGHSPLKFLVECKKYSTKKIGVEIIRSFKDVILTENANRGILVTTSYFSKDAKNKRVKESPYILDYKDRDDVMNWVEDYWKIKTCR